MDPVLNAPEYSQLPTLALLAAISVHNIVLLKLRASNYLARPSIGYSYYTRTSPSVWMYRLVLLA